LSLSLIIPTYNRLELLKITLDNIFHQSLIPNEIIVVDSGCTDGTIEYLNKTYPNIITTKSKGKSPAAARNTGFQIATGKYIQFFDSDDVMTKNKLESQYNLLEKTKQPLCYCPYVHAYQNENNQWIQKDVIIQYKPIPANVTLHDCMAKGFFTIIPGFLFRRNFLEQIGLMREDITAYEDWDFLWRIGSKVSNPLHTNDCCVIYRVHAQQITGNLFSNKDRDLDKMKCLAQIIENDKTLTIWQKQLLLSEVYKTNEKYKINIPVLENQNRMFLKSILLYQRINNKINRMNTQSNWQTMHGVNKSKEQFTEYLALIK